MVLKEQQVVRYSRNIMMPEISEAGQKKLLSSQVLIVGLGGLGSAVAYYLAASGIGKLYISDNEIVELSNLQRQILYTTEDVGQLKTNAAKKHLQALNPDIEIISESGLSIPLSDDLAQILEQVDVIVDCSDNFATRFAINKFCIQYKKDLVSGSAIGWKGQVASFYLHNPDSPCYVCLYPEQDAEEDKFARCEETGVISPIVGIIGSMQALATIKLLLKISSNNHLLRFDGLEGTWTSSMMKVDPYCKSCRISF